MSHRKQHTTSESSVQVSDAAIHTGVSVTFLHNAAPPHDARKGRHYYRRLHRPAEPSSIVVMTLAVILTMTQKYG